MTWPTAFVVVGALWAGVALLGALLWSRLKIAEVAAQLTELRLEHSEAAATRLMKEVQR